MHENKLYVPGFERTMPPYVPDVPSNIPLHECLECGDK